MGTERAFVGIGANLGQPVLAVRQAALALAGLRGAAAFELSPLYRTAPVDASGPDFINAVAAFDTDADPAWLLAALQDIERSHGRERPFRNAPRTLDLDLLLLGQRVVDEPGLTVPHPRLHQRAFVLRPLLDLEPHAHIPGLGRAALLLPSVEGQALERLPA